MRLEDGAGIAADMAAVGEDLVDQFEVEAARRLRRKRGWSDIDSAAAASAIMTRRRGRPGVPS